jgi:hypothetical protein
MRVALVLILGTIAICGCASAASAQNYDPYRFCAEYGAGSADGGTNCYFMTYEQCMAAISGNGGFCRANLFYTGTPAARPRKHRAN